MKIIASVLLLIASFSAFSDSNCRQVLDENSGEWVYVCD